VVLLEELRHVDDQVADDRQAGQRAQRDRLLQAVHVGQAGQAVLAVDVHRVRAAHAFAAGTAEGHRVVLGLEATSASSSFLSDGSSSTEMSCM
jgi:phosphodiesterase/alkaline phosphatase D-like protein